MDSKKMSSGKAALAMLALAAVLFVTLAGVAAGAERVRAAAVPDAPGSAISAAQVATGNAGGTDGPSQGTRSEGYGTTDGDPNVPLRSADCDIVVGLVRVMIVLSTALGI